MKGTGAPAGMEVDEEELEDEMEVSATKLFGLFGACPITACVATLLNGGKRARTSVMPRTCSSRGNCPRSILCCNVGVTAETALKLSHEEESGSEEETDRLGGAAVKRESKRTSVSPAMGG